MKYTLEKYKGPTSRHTCPACGKKKEFARYIVVSTGEYLADDVGRCNREDNCGYHKKPSDRFENGGQRPESAKKKVYIQPEVPDYLPYNEVQKTLGGYENENLCRYLAKLFGWEQVKKTLQKYKVGTIERWGGLAVVFWQIDEQGCVRFGKVMKYGANGHRIGSNYINSMHKLLSRAGKVRDNYVARQCFFGQHLLYKPGPVAIVESEKTALFCDTKFGKYIWLASSQMQGINRAKSRSLIGRDVVMFPDAGPGERDWEKRAKYVQQYARSVKVWKWGKHREKGADIMDMYV